MARSKRIKKRMLEPDAVYSSRMVSGLINKVMMSGKKSVAQKQVYSALEKIKKEMKTDPIEVFEIAVKNVGPRVEVRSRRVGGAAYQVPTEVKGDRKVHLALTWIIDAARAKSNKEWHTFGEKLASEIKAAYNQEGEAMKRKGSVHKMAEANRAFAHFRW